jgi:hypothetical protein
MPCRAIECSHERSPRERRTAAVYGRMIGGVVPDTHCRDGVERAAHHNRASDVLICPHHCSPLLRVRGATPVPAATAAV